MRHLIECVAMIDEVLVIRLGTVPYLEAWELQKELAERRRRQEISDVLLLLEHPPTYTYGRGSQPEELPMGTDWYEARGIEVHETDQGGLVTYHGPGQLIAYPIVGLRNYGNDVHAYVRGLEQIIISVFAEAGVPAQAIKGLTGVWTRGDAPPSISPTPARKIASIGLHVSRGITTHGLAINVNNDLEPFEWIVTCGIGTVAMTSLMQEGNGHRDSKRVSASLIRHYGCVVGKHPEMASHLGVEHHQVNGP